MQPRQIATAAAVIVGAFVLAFVAGKAAGGGGGTATAAPASAGKVIQVPAAAVSADVSGGSLPELREVKPKPTATPEPAAPSTPTPSSPTPSTPAPSTPAPAPAPAPAPTAGPIVGGDET
jgi:hypothetical protein